MKKRLVCILLMAVMVLTACGGGSASSTAAAGSTAAGSAGSTAAGGADAGDGGYRDVLRVGLEVDAGPLDPRTATVVSTNRVNEMVFDGLVDIDENIEAVPCLAESWENPEPTTWIFHLREGVKFHDGSDFTAEDVKYTFDTILDPDFGSTARSQFSSIDEVVAVDDYTVQFNLNQPFAPLLSLMDRGIVPSDSGDDPEFGEHPIGTGPYKFASWDKNSMIAVERNDDYWDGQAKTPRIEFHIIPDNSTRTAALEAGDVDIIHSPLAPADVTRLEGTDGFVVHKIPSLSVTFLNFNVNGDVMSDEAVRIAVSYMVDKQTIANDIYMGMDEPANSTLSPASWAYSADTTNYEYDPAKGLEILEEAGYTDSDGDGFLDKDGKKLTIPLSTHTEDANRIQAVEYIQNTLLSNGIDATVSTYEWATFDADVRAGNYECALLGLIGITDPDRYLYERFHTGAGNNTNGYSNPEVDKLLEEARASSDQEERAKLYQEAAQIINDEVVHNVLLYQGYIAITSDKVEGFTPMPNMYLRCLDQVTVKN